MDDATKTIDLPEGWIETAYTWCEYMARRKDRDSAGAADSFSLYQYQIQTLREMVTAIDAADEVIFETSAGSGVPRWLWDEGGW